MRSFPVRLRGQCRHGVGPAGQGRLHHLRRAESRLDHRRSAFVEGADSSLPPQRCLPRRRATSQREGRARQEAADQRRRLLDGWRHRPSPRSVRGGGKIRRNYDGRRRPRLGRARPQRPWHNRSLQRARPCRCSGRNIVEGHRRAGRIRLRIARSDRLPLSPGAPVFVFDVASAVRRGNLHRRFRRSGK